MRPTAFMKMLPAWRSTKMNGTRWDRGAQEGSTSQRDPAHLQEGSKGWRKRGKAPRATSPAATSPKRHVIVTDVQESVKGIQVRLSAQEQAACTMNEASPYIALEVFE